MGTKWIEINRPYDLKKNGSRFFVRSESGERVFLKVHEVKGNKVRVSKIDTPSYSHLICDTGP